MAYDESLADRIRELVSTRPVLSERRMFGGLAFMTAGNMLCGVVGDELMVRIGAEKYAECLSRPGARPMDFTGRPMTGMIYVNRQAVDTDLSEWLDLAFEFAGSLPPKQAKTKSHKSGLRSP